MELAFDTKELRAICEEPDVALAALGQAMAMTLRDRVADLRAADNLSELPLEAPTEAFEGGSVELPLSNGGRLIFHVAQPSLRWTDGRAPAEAIWRLKIMRIEVS